MSDKENLGFKTPQNYNRRALASARLIPQELLDRQGYRRGDFWLGRTMGGRPFGWNEELNLLTCAGPGAGKGVSSVIPNLLEFPGSMVVVDPKGELATLTAAYRRDVLGQKVIVLDPTGAAKVSNDLRGTYNPLDELDPDDPLVTTAAQVIASGIVVPNPKAKDPFWDDNAHDFIQSCILYMVRHYPPAMRTLMKLRETVSRGDRGLFDAWVKQKQEDDPDFKGSPADAFSLFLRAMSDTDDFGGVVSETAAKIGRMGENTQGGVLSSAATHLDFLKSPELWSVLESNLDPARTFQLRELRRQDRPLTVYLCLPVDMIPRQGRWFRLIVARIIQYIERSEFDKSKDLPIMMMIDESVQLGPLPSITNTLTYARSFGLRLWLIVQDLNQLKTNYPEAWETILGACGIKQFFGVNDLFTARYVSELIGEEEIDVPSISLTKTYSDATGKTVTNSTNQTLTNTTSTQKNISTGLSTSHNRSEGFNSGQSRSTGTNTNSSSNTGSNQSTGGTDSQSNKSSGTSYGSGLSSGSSAQASSSTGYNSSSGSATSVSRNISAGTGTSNAISSGTGRSDALSNTHTAGENYAFSVSKQKRRRLLPEDVLMSFTRDNMVQLTHIRDQGGMMLFRTPYYADPYFRWLLTEAEKK